jgi:hypothetical protein
VRLREEIFISWRRAALNWCCHRFHELLGWQRWRGPAFAENATGSVVTHGEHGGFMILGAEPAMVAELVVAMTWEDRPGDAW